MTSKSIPLALALPLLLLGFQNCGEFRTATQISSLQTAGLTEATYARPSIQWGAPVPALSNSSSLELSIMTQLDPSLSLRSLRCQINQSPSADCSSKTLSLLGLQDGDHTLTVTLTDAASQIATLGASIRLDRTPPSFILSEKPAAVTGMNSARLTFSATDLLSSVSELTFECAVDVADFTACSSPLVLSGLAPGSRSVKVRAIDKAKNKSAVQTVNWTIDASAPVLMVSEKPSDVSNSKTPRVAFAASQNGSPLTQFNCQLDQQSGQACTSPWTQSALAEGRHTLTLRAWSLQGSWSEPLTFSWIVDSISPTTPVLTTMTSTTTTSRSLSFAFMSTDAGSAVANYECALNSGAFAACTSPKSYSSLGDGPQIFKVKSVDLAGNRSLEATFAWMVQTETLDGKVLYANNCQGCHGPLGTSAKAGRNEAQILSALSNVSQMSNIRLTRGEVEAVALALAPSANPGGLTPVQASMKYFPGATTQGVPKRISRLTREQLDITVKSLLPAYTLTSLKSALPPDPLITNYEYSELLAFNAANFTPYKNWLEQTIAQVRLNPKGVIDCASQNNSAACLDSQARLFITKAFRGDVGEAKLSELSQFFRDAVAQTDLATATADLVDLVLSSPTFLFREEFDTTSASMLVPAERLQLLTYSLADAPPEKLSFMSTNAAALVATSAQESTVHTILATPEARAKLSRFFLAWLEVKEANEFSIAQALFPEFTSQVAASAVNETKKFLTFNSTKSSPRLKDFTQATQSYIDTPLASIYGITTPDSSGNTLVNLNPAQRLGLFSQVSVLASHSGPDTTRPVKRGAFFARKVMCVPIAGTPPDVNTSLPTDGGKTLRQKIETATSDSRCLSCHTTLNPLGFFQESYAGSGKWRTSENGLPVDSKISYTALDEGPLNADNPVATLRGLTASMMFKQCFIRQLFRFYVGRDETPSDDPVLKEMFIAFGPDGEENILAALRVLMTSNRLQNR